MVSTSSLAQLRSMLTDHGTLVVGGAEDMGKLLGIGRQLRAVALSPFVGQRLTMLVSKEHFSGLERLRDLIERGEVTPVVEQTFPLADAPDSDASARSRRRPRQAGRHPAAGFAHLNRLA